VMYSPSLLNWKRTLHSFFSCRSIPR
jgi:hypothetical protein